MSPDIRIISIGTLGAHPLWGEREATRTGHATTTLIRTATATILVDPGLPDRALVQRLWERACMQPSQITHVFLTSFHPDTHRGIGAFEHATWLIAKPEREGVGIPMVTALRHALEQGNEELQEAVRTEVAILERCEEAPDTLAEGVDIFPLPGVTPGLTGLLIEGAGSTTVVCGDAVPTVEHILKGQVLPWAANLRDAKASFQEALEIADYLVLGRDNIVPSPGRSGPTADDAASAEEDDEYEEDSEDQDSSLDREDQDELSDDEDED